MQSTMCWLVRPGPLNWSCHPFVLSDFIFAESLCMFINPLSSIIVSSTLISIVFPSFLIAVTFVLVIYSLTATFYRASARETKVRFANKKFRGVYREIFPATRCSFAVVVKLPLLRVLVWNCNYTCLQGRRPIPERAPRTGRHRE